MKSNQIKVITRNPEKYPEKYPEELKILLNIITINEVPKVVGSYTNHKYQSNVDVFERVTLAASKQEAAKLFSIQFKNIIY